MRSSIGRTARSVKKRPDSCSYTSIAQPEITPLSSASINASVSIRPPRAVLMMTAVFFIVFKVSSLIIWNVLFIRGQCRLRTSDSLITSGRDIYSTPISFTMSFS
ncbi:hypothetical protein PBCV1_a056L [Paramecium bursaria Chlorella virus 1]|uniref:Uncharacterized protein n=1 Tax=Paramecium bursaria Chlorella virus 1 TaxID=10506 RepID=Q89391_PBCV1|nr:hypothetical protein PBCV1_a056L [Paramecium bursaria Chlorella virus 1]AAC96424.1 hypothetical protein [Paramecium bursaria Chlorella virus 1]